MSRNRLSDNGNARAGQNNGDSEDEQGSFSLRKEEQLQVCVKRTVQQVIEKLEPMNSRIDIGLAQEMLLAILRQNSESSTQPSETRNLKLKFLKKLSNPVFTGVPFPMMVALVDASTEEVVKTGPEASARVEIVVLEGSFDDSEGNSWSLEEINNKIIKGEMEGGRSLLPEKRFLNLNKGIGVIDISFTHNRYWRRNCKLRLGAIVVGYLNGTSVRPAMTESFVLKDRRGTLCKKHYPPSLHDDVWRLEKIWKNGAFHKRLRKEKINTVKDFLTQLYIDPVKLRITLGTGMSAKTWEATTNHARTCTLDPRLYFYCPQGSEQKTGVIFNVVAQVVGLVLECQYVHIDKLSEAEKAEAHDLVLCALQNREEVVPFNDEASVMDHLSQKFNKDPCSNSDMMETSDASETLTSQKIDGFDYPRASMFSMGCVESLDDFDLHNIDEMGLAYDQSLNFPGQFADSLICDTDSFTRAFFDEHLLYFDAADVSAQSQTMGVDSQADLQSVYNGFMVSRSAAYARKRWMILYVVLKWFSIGRVVKRTLGRKMKTFRRW